MVLLPSELVTVRATVPVPGGEVAVRVEPLTKTALTELLPKLTVAPVEKFEPVTVTPVPLRAARYSE